MITHFDDKIIGKFGKQSYNDLPRRLSYLTDGIKMAWITAKNLENSSEIDMR